MKPVDIGVQRYQRLEHGIFLTEFESRIGFKTVLIKNCIKASGCRLTVGRVSYRFLYKNFTAIVKYNCFWVAVMGVRIPPPRLMQDNRKSMALKQAQCLIWISGNGRYIVHGLMINNGIYCLIKVKLWDTPVLRREAVECRQSDNHHRWKRVWVRGYAVVNAVSFAHQCEMRPLLIATTWKLATWGSSSVGSERVW